MSISKKIHFTNYVSVLVFLFLLQSVFADENAQFSLDVKPIISRINVEEVAKYNVTISNRRAVADEFRMYILSYPEWDLRTDPLLNPIILEVPAFSQKSEIIYIDPLHVRGIGNYVLDLYAESLSTDNIVSKPVEVTIKSTEGLIEGYVPTILLNLDMPKKIDPREKTKIRLDIVNQNLLNHPELTIFINSNLINEKITERLGPSENKFILIEKKLPLTTVPQKDKVVVTLLRGNRTIDTVTQSIEVIGYTSLKSDEQYQRKFLKLEKRIRFRNDGNIVSRTPLIVKTDYSKEIFTVTKPRANINVINGVRYYVWEKDISPYESFEVVIVENYRPVFLLIVIILVSVIVYYTYRAPLIFKKSAKNIIKSHGGITQLQVSLSLKNRGKATLTDITITDTIPNLVHLDKGLLIGTVHPAKILSHEKKGTIVRWEIKNIDSGEERVITYNIKSRLPILGGLTLPSASAKFFCHGKECSKGSNRLDVKADKE